MGRFGRKMRRQRRPAPRGTPVVTTARKGDLVLACEHVDEDDDLSELHLIKLVGPDGSPVQIEATPDTVGGDVQGRLLTAKWILTCDECQAIPRPIEAANHHFVLPRDIEAVSD